MGSQPIGIILSKSTTSKAILQLYEEYEYSISEGELYVIRSGDGERILCRINRIIPYNEFYQEGDVWSEARRKRTPIPVDVSRRYVVAELELLGRITKGSLSDVTRPPNPGDEVYKLEEADLNDICGASAKKLVVYFGSLLGYSNMPLPLDLNALPMHIAVIGVTGSGKSYTMGYLIELLRKVNVGDEEGAVPLLIVDANGDYVDFHECYRRGNSALLGKYKKVYRFVFDKSPLKLKPASKVSVISVDLSELTLREIAELIVTYYSGGELNEMQAYGIEYILKNLVDEGHSVSQLFVREDLFERVLNELKRISDQEIHPQTKKAIERALRKFKEDIVDELKLITLSRITLDKNFVDELTKPGEPSLALIDFSADGAPGISLPVKQFVIAYLTKLLYNCFVKYKSEEKTRLLLLAIEEAQNYCPNTATFPISYSLARTNLANIATQGRKFRLCLCLISQRPSFIDPVVLSMVNTFIIHRISADDVYFVKRAAGALPSSIEERLTRLPTGHAVVMGQMNKLGFPVIVSIPKREIEPTMGKAEVEPCLRAGST